MFSELVQEFRGRRVVDFEGADSWVGPHVAYRLREEYEDEIKIADRLAALLDQPESKDVSALIIGAWSGACEGENAAEIVAELAECAPRLSGLRDLFLGEMTYEECEISWIKQANLTPLLTAYPNLESLRVRGGSELEFSPRRHDNLKELAIETGGLSRSTIRELFLCELPSLERLVLFLGEENYGFDGGVEDLQPLLSGRLFPRLKHLGLMNSSIANDIAAVLVNTPIVERLESIDLSLGNLDSEGVQSLTGLAAHGHLRQLNISHHYASEAAVEALAKALPFEVIAEDLQDPEDDWRPIVHAE
jgi:hypothetical protein